MNICRIFVRFLFVVSIFLTAGVASGQWKDTLPQNIRYSVLWYGDHEEGSLADYLDPGFRYKGGGVYFNHYDDNTTGGSDEEAVADTARSHSGRYSARATITNAYHTNGSRAVRLMRWTDRAWDNGGRYFPTESYYSAWYYFPYKYNPNKYDPCDSGDGGWWNIFQFKSNDSDDISQPTWTLNVAHDDTNNYMYFYLYSKYNPPNSYSQLPGPPIPVPVGRWFHIEAFVRKSDTNGQIKIWQDGVLILDVDNILTAFMADQDQVSLRYQIVWGTGNYTDHITGYPGEDGKATLYIDDAIVSTERVSSVLSQPDGVIEIQPISRYDDSEEGSGGGIDVWSTDLELTEDGGLQTVGIRFPGIAIPQGASIIDAYIEFQAKETDSVDTSVAIAAEAIDDGPQFTKVQNDITSRTVTGASVAWQNIPPWNIVGEKRQTPNIGLVVQEVVNRAGWQSGNALVVIITGTGKRTAMSYDGSASGAPRLFVSFTTDSDNLPPVITNPGNQSNEEGDVVLLAISARDPDGDSLSFSATGLPPWLSIDSLTGVISGTIADASTGVYNVVVTVRDGEANDVVPFTWTIFPGGVQSIEIQPISWYDDAEEDSGGGIDVWSTDLELTEDGGLQTVGIRFPGIAIPQGASIIDAYIEFQPDETDSVATSVVIAAEAIDEGLPFTEAQNDITRPYLNPGQCGLAEYLAVEHRGGETPDTKPWAGCAGDSQPGRLAKWKRSGGDYYRHRKTNSKVV